MPGIANVARDRGYNVTVFHRGSLLKASGANKRSNKPSTTRQPFTQPMQNQQNLGQFIADLYKTAYGSLCSKFAHMAPCQVRFVFISYQRTVHNEDTSLLDSFDLIR